MKLTKENILSGDVDLRVTTKDDIAEFAATLDGFVLTDGTKKEQMNAIVDFLEDSEEDAPEPEPEQEPEPEASAPEPEPSNEQVEESPYMARRKAKIDAEIKAANEKQLTAEDMDPEEYEKLPAFTKRRMRKR